MIRESIAINPENTILTLEQGSNQKFAVVAAVSVAILFPMIGIYDWLQNHNVTIVAAILLIAVVTVCIFVAIAYSHFIYIFDKEKNTLTIKKKFLLNFPTKCVGLQDIRKIVSTHIKSYRLESDGTGGCWDEFYIDLPLERSKIRMVVNGQDVTQFSASIGTFLGLPVEQREITSVWQKYIPLAALLFMIALASTIYFKTIPQQQKQMSGNTEQPTHQQSCLFDEKTQKIGDVICGMVVSSISPSGIIFNGRKDLKVFYFAGDMFAVDKLQLRARSRYQLPYQVNDYTMSEHPNMYSESGDGDGSSIFDYIKNEPAYGNFSMTNPEDDNPGALGNGVGTVTIDQYIYGVPEDPETQNMRFWSSYQLHAVSSTDESDQLMPK